MAKMVKSKNDSILKLEEEITCPLCLRPLDCPKRLPCDHTYCKSPCLEGLLQTSKNSTITCPECSTIIQVQDSDLDNIPNAFHIERLKDVYSEMVQASVTTPQGASPPCPTHSTQLQDLYCKTCQKVVCRDCILLAKQHEHHEYSLVTRVAEKNKDAILQDLEKVELLAEQIDAALVPIERAELDIEKQRMELVDQITISFEALFHVLQEQKQTLLDTLNKEIEHKLATLTAQKGGVQAAMTKLQGAVESVKGATTTDTGLDFISKMSQLRDELSDTTETSKDVAYRPEAQPDLSVRVLSPEKLGQACTLTSHVRRIAPDPARCRIERRGPQDGTVGDASTFAVHLVNTNDIPCHGDVVVKLRTLRDGSVTRPTVTALSPSCYEVSYTPATRGRHELSVTVNGEHIIGSPFRVFIRILLSQLNAPDAAITDLSGPTGVHYTGEEILVTDYDDGHVIVYDQHLQRVASIGGDRFHGKKLKGCVDSITDHMFNVYVTTLGDNHLHKFSKDGTHIKSVSGTGKRGGGFNFPNGMLIIEDFLYVCDTKRNRLVQFTTDLEYILTIDIDGMPVSINGYANKMYVCIKDCRSIKVLGMYGQPLQDLSHTALNRPVTTAIFSNLLYVTDCKNHHVAIFTLSGDYIGSFGDGHLRIPEGIAIDDDGYFYITNSRKNVLVF